MADDHVLSFAELRRFTVELVGRFGAPGEIAEEVGSHLVRANLSGHDSHGVARLPQYLAQIDKGALVPGARPELLTETDVLAVMDAKRGFGQYTSIVALEWAMSHAQRHGLAAVSIRRSMHVGRLGEYSERAAEAGLVALVTAGSAGENVGGVGLPGARGRYFGTNPWSFGFPSTADPVVFDGSMSTVAEGKVRLARATGKTLPDGCIVDGAGRPSTDPEDFYAGGALLPLGGRTAGHKGYGLALVSALLGGLSAVGDTEPTVLGAQVAGDGDPRGRVSGMFVLVLDPAAFAPDGYPELVGEVAAGLKRAPGEPGALLPGEPEVTTRHARSEAGISLPDATWRDLGELAARFDVAVPRA
ncbi:Ldh family oxidoreductase [Amycolatopsis acidiphila]|uniref:Ldh family oxidoreductase n=1 Tax=Amycolatopsis acidiphila TaxID=715473 RepID=A0A558AJ97_9PSEU|nr:Ldh family oxidoreductase [Amycolatopsis acidiphila]TVT24342.1 Ldh family oxidoreductase [Amycolatopsis acidiphila]UIJ62522.1 Ldh family oxidoreductase [Amycolatopsis acidiphila]GHG85186.1 dehydrogenase [Amycolatopsis acidiphila]